jgi:LmbE family N-acetylglucosaminyl deacetylase
MLQGGRILLFFAHPDDETAACGGQLHSWTDCVIVHTTTGSPDDLGDARRAGFESQTDYAAARQRELHAALAEIGGREVRNLGFTDQKSWRDLELLVRTSKSLIESLSPDAVLTHPYEGGHPDHDAAAFAIQHACRQFGAAAPRRFEAAFYHRAGGNFRTLEFLPGPRSIRVDLTSDERARKQQMVKRFVSQADTLAQFPITHEEFRPAPDYDFSEPPHPGQLNYEFWGWPVRGVDWRREAIRAEKALRG